MRQISKSFGGVKALTNAELTAEAGKIHAVMGENGAGKSTLIKILAGAVSADPGRRDQDRRVKPVTIGTPAAAMGHGIAVIYQELSLSPNLTVAENIYLGREIRKGIFADRKAMQARCRGILESLGATFSPTDLWRTFRWRNGSSSRSRGPFMPMCVFLSWTSRPRRFRRMNSERLFELIERLRESGLAIVYVSHRMAEIARLADSVTVLRDGAYVGTISRAELTPERLVRMMVGRDLAGFYKKEAKSGPSIGRRPSSR